MLIELRIRNFTLIQALDLNFENGMSVLTGETGAGKSIFIDAIELGLGARGDVRWIRQGEQRCEISLLFDLTKHVAAKAWLLDNDFALDSRESDDDKMVDNDCLIRRVLTQDGRSRCYINDQAVSLQRVKVFGALLLTMHGQHHNQLLFEKSYQRQQLDGYLGQPSLIQQIQHAYQCWKDLIETEKLVHQKSIEAQAKLDFLDYQLNELAVLKLQENEYEKLASEQKQLAHSERLLQDGNLALQKIAIVENDILKMQSLLKPLLNYSNTLQNITALLENAHIQIQEAQHELDGYLETLGENPDQLSFIEQRLSDVYTLARKYRVPPNELHLLQVKLQTERNALGSLDLHKQQLETDIRTARQQYNALALQLGEQRQLMAKKMSAQVQHYLPSLGMANACFEIRLISVEPSLHGNEAVEFWMATNPGQAPQPLEKILSGGELSRLNLAVQAVFTQVQKVAVLIFDEIDTGIGGSVASLAGELMHLLSQQTQVIAITHLPQLAARADHHYVVEKSVFQNNTSSTLKKLSPEKRIEEMARMLGGVKITDRTIAHARELLEC